MSISTERQFEHFYKETFKGLFRFFYYKSVDLQSIEELCQEVYMRFWNGYKIHLNDFTQSKKIVYGIALNVYREWVRSSIKNDNLALEDYWTQLAEEDKITCTDHWSNNDYEKNI